MSHSWLFLQAITDPLTDHVIQINKSLITLTAQGIPVEDTASMIKVSLTCPCSVTEQDHILYSPCERGLLSMEGCPGQLHFQHVIICQDSG